MNHQHLIDRAVFNTAYAGEAAAFERRSEVDEFVKSHLLNVVEEVFDRQASDDTGAELVFRIDRLEIDLGTIPVNEFRQQMPQKLRQELLSALSKIRYRATQKPRASLSLVDRANAARAELFYFLLHGYLPWYSRLASFAALEALMVETLDYAESELIGLMADNRQRPQLVERLVNQFSQPTVERIFGLIPALKIYADKFTRTETPWAPRSEESSSLPGGLEPMQQSASEPLPNRLMAAILAGEVGSIESLWRTAYATHPRLLEETLRRYGQQAIVRRAMVAGFTPALFSQALRMLEPVEHEFVQRLLEQAALFQFCDAGAMTSLLQLADELREFTLVYLLLERGARFDRLAYVASLLRQLAELHAIDTGLLAKRLRAEIENRDQPGRIVVELMALLPELTRETLSPAAEGRTATERYSSETPSIDTRYERLRSALTGAARGRPQQGFNLFDDIRAVRQSVPGLFTQLLAELQSSGQRWRRATEALSVGELAELCLGIILRGEVTQAGSGSGADLVAALLQHAAQVRHRKYFYLEVLERLIGKRPIDFSAIMTSDHQPEPSFDVGTGRNQPGDRTDGLDGRQQRDHPDAATRKDDYADEDLPLEEIYIANAGAVLIAPYLPKLFERLDLIEAGEFRNRGAAERAIHCVQFLVNENLASPEFELVLNKILCGVRPGLPIRPGIELNAAEREQLEVLLRSVLQHWKALGNTSVAGLREAFLQRNGRLQLRQDAWYLTVESKPYDMLLDQIPWTWSAIKFAWMERVIFVEWR